MASMNVSLVVIQNPHKKQKNPSMQLFKMLVLFVALLGSAQSRAAKPPLLFRGKSNNRNMDSNKVASPFFPRNLQECNLGEGAVECETSSQSCVDYEIQGCSPVYCMNYGACDGAKFQDSAVFCKEDSCKYALMKDSSVSCSGSYTCDSANIYRSKVQCTGDSLFGHCKSVNFEASAVVCMYSRSCETATFDVCSCCDDGPEYCPNRVPKCQANGAPSEAFCLSQSNGITCAALGNPACEGVPGYRDAVSGATHPQDEAQAPGDGPTSPATASPADSPTMVGGDAAASPTVQETEDKDGDDGNKEENTEFRLEIWIPVIAASVTVIGGVIIAWINKRRKVKLEIADSVK